MDAQEPGDEDFRNRVQVVVRVRPILPNEVIDDVAVACSKDGTKVQVMLNERELNKPALAASNRPDGRSYEFDACLNGSTTQEQLFHTCGMDELVEAAIEGFTVTMFAFGQTGSGKTYSIIGPRLSQLQENDASYDGQLFNADKEEDGMLTRCMNHAYRTMEARANELDVQMELSCMEIYNETITDLLAQDKTRQLQIRQDKEGFYVHDLTQALCPTARTAHACLARALAWRHTRSHRLNNYSSRSHCMTTLLFRSQDRLQEGAAGGVRRTGRLVLVDLAGSERLKDTGSTDKEALRETGHINKSLFVLGQVLASLSAKGNGSNGHVPFRDSKLTQLLWEGLRGNGRTLMLACLGPLKQQAEESLNTLHFASMALRIKSTPVVMMDPQDQLVMDLRSVIKGLREDVRNLAGALTQMSQGSEVSTVLQALPGSLLQDALRAGATNSAPTQDQRGRAAASRQAGGRQPMGYIGPKPSSSDALRPTMARGSSPSRQPSPSRQMQQHSSRDAIRHSWNTSPSTAFGSRAPALRSPPSPLMRQPMSPPRSRGNAAASTSYHSSQGRQHTPTLHPGSPTYLPRQLAAYPAQQPAPLNAAMMGMQGAMHRPHMPSYSSPAASPPSRAFGGMAGGSGGSRGSPGMPMSGVSSFPELAALEADFLQHMNSITTGQGPVGQGMRPQPSQSQLHQSLLPQYSATAVPLTSNPHTSPVALASMAMEHHLTPQQLAALQSQQQLHMLTHQQQAQMLAQQQAQQQQQEAEQAAAAAAVAPPVPAPEPKALTWAERNSWFGTDQDMTEFAYQVHDTLVTEEGVDPSSDAYYDAIEQRVAQQFPDKWAAVQAANEAAAREVERQQQQQQQQFQLQQQQQQAAMAYTRVQLKDPTPTARDAAMAHRPAGMLQAQAAAQPGASALQQGSYLAAPSAQQSSYTAQALATQTPGSYGRPGDMQVQSSGYMPAAGNGGYVLPQSLSTRPGALTGMQPSTASMGVSSSAMDMALRPDWSSSKWPKQQAGRDLANALRSNFQPGAKSLAELQMEYNRQRMLVVDELRRAKEEAEGERKRILMQVGRAIGSHKWQ